MLLESVIRNFGQFKHFFEITPLEHRKIVGKGENAPQNLENFQPTKHRLESTRTERPPCKGESLGAWKPSQVNGSSQLCWHGR